MASRSGPLNLAAPLLAAGLAVVVLGPVVALALSADRFSLRSAEWSALRFTLMQAGLSALISATLAVPLARALARRQFPGHGMVVTLLGAPFLLPVVVAVVGMLSVYGKTGVINAALTALHLPNVTLFGLQGVVLTNVFFNLPLCTRILLNGWHAIPAERFRLADALALPPSARFRHLELPMLRIMLPGACVSVFLLCLGSFVISLTFGGGPRATTLELAIYQALRFDFDLGRASLLAGLQFTICAVAVLLASWLKVPAAGRGLDRMVPQLSGHWPDLIVIPLAVGFLALPLLMVLRDGLPGLFSLPLPIWSAALRSSLMALSSAMLASTGALILALNYSRMIEAAAMLPMAASGLVLGTGLFLILRPLVSPDDMALPVTVMVNAVLALPLVYRLLLPEARALRADYGPLCAALNLRGLARLRYVTLPRLARPLGFGAGVAAGLSMGDLGVIALFAGQDNATLPLMISRLAGAYRMEDAAAASLVLVTLSFGLFVLFDRGGRHAAP